ncbi:hypothetical protein ACNKU7_12115 [Microbulbifer sp. SA54]|uniref:hypothetical protein n=1 Tax=Microbulbifer sp. SA54 TaxID=3401577 RepID=UPI003AAD2B8E
MIKHWQEYSGEFISWLRARAWSAPALVLVIAGVYALQFWPVLFGTATVFLAAIFLTPIFFAKYQLISTFYDSEESDLSFPSLGVMLKTAGSVCAFYMLGWGLACPVKHNAALIVSSYLFVMLAACMLYWNKSANQRQLSQVLRVTLFKHGLIIGFLYSGVVFFLNDVSIWSSVISFFDRDLCGIYLSFQSGLDSLAGIFPEPFDTILKLVFNLNIAFGFIFVLYAYSLMRVWELLHGPAESVDAEGGESLARPDPVKVVGS